MFDVKYVKYVIFYIVWSIAVTGTVISVFVRYLTKAT